MQYSKVKTYVEKCLQGLDSKLTYHNAWHTMGDVLPVAITFASKVNINQGNLTILKTAVLFHDLGYLQQYENNESIGAKMAEEILPQYDYNPEQIEIITKLIISTQIPQKPSTLLEKIICDSDLDSLHRDDFVVRGNDLMAEVISFKNEVDEFDWLNIQLKFIKNHTYHLDVDINKRNAGKLENISLLDKRIASLDE
ncbi:MAG: HD domain-containing protein [Gammaproteobacteria bacterium]|nr:HD domain-containing protein [Gammaproteobacteria bacterium]